MRYSGILALIAFVLSACTTSSHNAPDTGRANTFVNYNLPSINAPETIAFIAADSSDWWRVLNDPFLNRIVDQSRTNAFDVRRALADVERAEAVVRGTRSLGMPGLELKSDLGGLKPDIGSGGSASVTTSAEVALAGSWTIDLFGQARNSVRSAEASLEMSEATKRDIERLVISRTVQAYASLRNLDVRLALARQNEARLTENTDRIVRLVDGGYATLLDLRRSESQLYELQARTAELENLKAASVNALSLLTTLPPGDILRMPGTEPVRLAIPVSLPAPDLERVLVNRPDIRAAEWGLYSASYQADASRAALYPNLTLNSSVFSSGQALGEMPDLTAVSGSLIASLAAPLLGRGRLLAAVDQSTAEVDRALVTYERAILSGLLEIDTSITTWTRLNEKLDLRARSVGAAVEAQELAQRLFYAGELDFTSLIVSEQFRLNAEDAYLVAEGETLSAYIDYVSAVVPVW